MAVQIQAGICACMEIYTSDAAFILTDNLIEKAGFIVEGAPELESIHSMD